MKYLALALVLIAGCKTHLEQETKLDAKTEAVKQADQHVESKTVTTAPVKRRIVERWRKLPLAFPELRERQSQDVGVDPLEPLPPGLTDSLNGIEYERITEEQLAPVEHTETVADLKSQEREDSTLEGEARLEKTRDFLHGPFVWIGALVTLAGVAFGVWKLRKAVPL